MKSPIISCIKNMFIYANLFIKNFMNLVEHIYLLHIIFSMKQMKNSSILILTFMILFILSSCDDESSNTTTNNQNINNENIVLTPETVLQACLIKDGCGFLSDGFIKQCVYDFYDRIPYENFKGIWEDTYKCVLKAQSDCIEVGKCFGEPVSCDFSIEKGYCDGNMRYYCDSLTNSMYGMNCGIQGLNCETGQDDYPVCTEATCISSSYEDNCDGNIMKYCENEIVTTRDCSVYDLFCQRIQIDATSFQVTCGGDGGQCEVDQFENSCDGNLKISCLNGTITTVDCSIYPINKKCEPGLNNNVRCVPEGTECEPDDEYCEDSYLAKVCIDGTFINVDCRDLGFGRCSGVGPSPGYGAHCR
jgi:hypothetical protein